MNAPGLALLADAFEAQLRGEESEFWWNRYADHAAIAASGHRSVLEPGELNVGQVAFDARRRPFDLVAQEFVQRLLDVEERHYVVEHEYFREDCLVRAMSECDRTPAPLALPYRQPEGERPPVRRTPQIAIADDLAYWRAKTWRPETLIYEPLDTEPWYRMLIAELAPEWTLDERSSSKKHVIFVRALGPSWQWYLVVPPPSSGLQPSLRMGPTKRGRVSPERDTLSVPCGPVDLSYLGSYNPRGIEVFTRYVIAGHFRRLIDFLGPAFGAALDAE